MVLSHARLPFRHAPKPGPTGDRFLSLTMNGAEAKLKSAAAAKAACQRVCFVLQSDYMDSNWAAEHLQVIRTLMERSALYRRALAPVMTWSGVMGTVAAAGGILAGVRAPAGFIGYWMVVAVAAVAGSFLLARRQALKDSEPFWSPPTRRVAQALLPALFFGLVLGLALLTPGAAARAASAAAPELVIVWLPLMWVALYGCALHAAGFFMPRGMKVFGAALVLGSSAFCVLGVPTGASLAVSGHGIMGLCFGLAHLAYGGYLYVTESRGNTL